ncbi:hypothetical protein COMA1_40195 [Candidatus Nitrospira nitrosa]|uniref:Uncharacterized protein n=1 Tax=Candidatus Nitrospira nitrosa TaxID=1742972 RepID=A0A0S4LM42_9BACT|nr:hypothetical protein COMA1_40195 [Candidatus Nitrospira nitrosa]
MTVVGEGPGSNTGQHEDEGYLNHGVIDDKCVVEVSQCGAGRTPGMDQD